MAGGDRKTRLRSLLAKIEGTYGTDSAPVPADNSIETKGLDIQPLVADEAEHDVDRPSFGNNLSTLVNKRVVVPFMVAMAGSGTAGAAPKWGPLMRACSMSEAINVGTDVRYAPIDSSQESVTLWPYIDGVVHKVVGCRGTWDIEISSGGGFPYFNFNFTGLYAGPVTAAMITPVLTGFQSPKEINNANTAVTLHSQSVALNSLQVSLNNVVVPRDVPGSNAILSTGRTTDGNIDVDALDHATKDWLSTVVSLTTGELNVIHGTTAGNIVELDADNAQLITPGYGDVTGILTHKFGLKMLPDSGGGGDLEIICR